MSVRLTNLLETFVAYYAFTFSYLPNQLYCQKQLKGFMYNEHAHYPLHRERVFFFGLYTEKELKGTEKQSKSQKQLASSLVLPGVPHGSDNLTVMLGEPDSDRLSTIMMISLY